jgi:hypothetical protein
MRVTNSTLPSQWQKGQERRAGLDAHNEAADFTGRVAFFAKLLDSSLPLWYPVVL